MAFGLKTYEDILEREDLLDVIKGVKPITTSFASQGISSVSLSPSRSRPNYTEVHRWSQITCPNCKKDYDEGSEHNCMAGLKNLLKNL
jgi:hypothetical protein